jgi:hypothetical protein
MNPTSTETRREKNITVTFRDGKPAFTLSGTGVRYEISPVSAPGCVKLYQGTYTKIFPLEVVQDLDIYL